MSINVRPAIAPYIKYLPESIHQPTMNSRIGWAYAAGFTAHFGSMLYEATITLKPFKSGNFRDAVITNNMPSTIRNAGMKYSNTMIHLFLLDNNLVIYKCWVETFL